MENKHELKDMVVAFYTGLFSSNPDAGGELVKGKFPLLEDCELQRLGENYTTEEVRRALKQMNSLKAPGLDGFQAIFFKRTWNTTGLALSDFILGVLKGMRS